MNKVKKMKKIHDELVALKKSPLYKYRVSNKYKVVVGEGDPDANIIFIGEAPGKNEAISGKPFCGASGKILDQLLDHIGLNRETVYVTNIVKDRPPENRNPKKDEIEFYTPFLLRQIELIEPKVVVTLGNYSMKSVMKSFGLKDQILPIGEGKGKKHRIKTEKSEFIMIPLYHPAVAVYNANRKGELKKDFRLLKKYI